MRMLLTMLALIAWNGDKIVRSEGDWLALLGEERFNVMRKKGTEHAFTGKYVYATAKGHYCCAACDLPLFLADDKYDAGSGWPCFIKPAHPKNVYYLEDLQLPFKRYEVLCSRCEGHLGHVFHDGPPPKHLRYTINSISIHLGGCPQSLNPSSSGPFRDLSLNGSSPMSPSEYVDSPKSETSSKITYEFDELIHCRHPQR